MKPIYNSLLRFGIYLSVLLISIAVFYSVDGKFETDTISFPTLWTAWFYFLYIVIPFFILVRLIYRVFIKNTTHTDSLHSVVFIVSLVAIQTLYWVTVNSYKKMLFYDIQNVKEKIEAEFDSIDVVDISSGFEINKFNKKHSYKVLFTTLSKPTYKTDVNISSYVAGADKRLSLRTLSLLPNKSNQNHYFYIVEKTLRDKVTSKDKLDFKISYSIDFPRKKYKYKAELAQQLCTWSIIACGKMGKEVAWHDTELFDSTIFRIPYKVTSSEKPLIQINLSEFKNLDLLLPFTNISFLSEETTRKDGVIETFVLKFKVDSRVSGHIYNQIASAEHSGKLLTIPLEDKSVISKGENIISIPVDINELSTLISEQKESDAIKFNLFFSNNRSWYCPNFICEIKNNPNQMVRFVVTTKNSYRVKDFPE